jgi:DNA-directed RNA polymerase specialized sigma subunit
LDDSYSDSKTRFDEVYGLEDPGIDKGVVNEEIVSYLLEKTQLLSQFEKQFFFYLVSEKNQEEIMALLNINSRQFYRIRNKIRKIIDIDIIKDYFK